MYFLFLEKSMADKKEQVWGLLLLSYAGLNKGPVGKIDRLRFQLKDIEQFVFYVAKMSLIIFCCLLMGNQLT